MGYLLDAAPALFAIAGLIVGGIIGHMVGFHRGQSDEQRRIRKRIEKGVRTFAEVGTMPREFASPSTAAIASIEQALRLGEKSK